MIANPPFGGVMQEDGSKKLFSLGHIVPGFTTRDIDHAIALNALEAMKDEGRAVLLLAGPNPNNIGHTTGYRAVNKLGFYKALYDRYNVVDHFTVSGDLYKKQGAQWPVDVVVIDGRGKAAREVPAILAPSVIGSWDELKSKLDAGARGTAGATPEKAPGPPGADDGVRQPRTGGEPPVGNPAQDGPGDVRGGSSADGTVPDKGAAGDRPGISNEPGGARAGDDAVGRPPGVSPDKALDDALDEAFGPAQDKPTAKPKGKIRPARKPSTKPDTRPTTDVVKSAAANTSNALEAAVKGLGELFGATDKNKLSSGFTFDEETYRKALPLFKQAVENLGAALSDVAELARRLVAHLRDTAGWTRDVFERARPYLTRFMDEVRSGAIQLGPQKKAQRQEKETEGQTTYTPKSTAQGLGTLVPVNMKGSTQDSLDALEKRVGDLNAYVAEQIGYETDELGPYFTPSGSNEKQRPFAAEQIDALALAIDNIARGKGFIIGDQTGIGKGRVNAAIIRFAIKQGHVPVFVTEKPNLYGDMYRDLSDTGIQKYLGRDVRILATNNDLSVPLDEDGKVVLTTGPGRKHGGILAATTPENFTEKYDVVFTTYNQMQSVAANETVRRDFLRQIAPAAVLIFDESHNAGGQGPQQRRKLKEDGTPAPDGRSVLSRQLVTQARGVFYSSATYAKRPEVMDLYAATDMRLAVEKIENLAEAIARGGVPMQQAVATMLSKAGQYIRRERSFDGVTYDTPIVPVDKAQYEDVCSSLSLINDFSDFIPDAVERLRERLIREGQTALSRDEALNLSSITFASVMHNVVNQLLLSMKVGQAARMAIEAARRGEKPVLTVANTMETFLKDFVADTGGATGDVFDANFSAALTKYLKRVRTILIKDAENPRAKPTRYYLTNEDLGPLGVAAFRTAERYINGLDLSELAISPIDHMKNELAKAGLRVGEITGRNLTVDYSGDEPVLASRGSKETSIRGRRATITAFNNGELDVMVLNQAGATGLSLHAGEKFKDQRQRHMMIVQAEANIDTHMQMLGRVHRTGQVVVPTYSQLVADIPAEKRPAAVLAKKMASLNANTTASRTGALSAKDVPDFINEYGDQVAAQWVTDHPELHRRMGSPVEISNTGRIAAEGAIRALTGRVTLLKLAEQEELFDTLEDEYKGLLSQLEASGESVLEAKTYDLRASPVSYTEVVGRREGDDTSPFTAPVKMMKAEVNVLGKPYNTTELVSLVALSLGEADTVKDPDNARAVFLAMQKRFEDRTYGQGLQNYVSIGASFGARSVYLEEERRREALREFDAYVTRTLDAIDPDTAENPTEAQAKKDRERTRLADIRTRFGALHQQLKVGARVTLKTVGGNHSAIVLKMERKGSAKNPLALSTWKVTFALADASRQVTIPLSRVYETSGAPENSPHAIEVAPTQEWIENPAQTLDRFEHLQRQLREERYIALGNLLAAYEWLEMRGRVINFTDKAGNVLQGVLTPRIFDLQEQATRRGKELSTGQAMLDWMKEHPGQPLASSGGTVTIASEEAYGGGRRNYTISVPRGRNGRAYYQHQQLIGITRDFFSRSGRMQATFGEEQAREAFGIVRSIAAGQRESFRSPTNLPPTETATGDVIQTLSSGARLSSALRLSADQANLARMQVAAAIVQRVAGAGFPVKFFNELRLPPDLEHEAAKTAAGTNTAKAGDEYLGVYHWVDDFIHLSLSQSGVLPETAFHEAFHRLQNLGVFSEPEVGVMKRERKSLERYIERELGMKEGATAGFPQYEINAYAFGLWASAREGLASPVGVSPIHATIRRAFDRLMQLLRVVRNALEGFGWRTSEGVFDAARRGEMARRIEAMGAKPGDYKVRASFSTMSRARQDEIEAMNAAHGMPATATAARPPSFTTPKATIIDRARSVEQDSFTMQRKVQRAIEDVRGAPLPESVDAYLAQTLFRSRTSEALEAFQKDEVKPLFKAIAAEKLSIDDVGTYLLAKHAPERNATIAQRNNKFALDGGSGMADGAAHAFLAQFTADGKTPGLERVAKMVYAILRKGLDRRLAAGLITPAQHHQWTSQWQYYVPLRGKVDDELEDMHPRGKGFNIRGKESQAATGRESLSTNALHTSILAGEESIMRSEKNRVDKRLLAQVQQNPNPELWRVYKPGSKNPAYKIPMKTVLDAAGMTIKVPDTSVLQGDNVIGVKVGGHQWYIELHDEQMAKAYRALGPELFQSKFIANYAYLSRQWAQLQTGRNPEWFIKNFLRDVQEAAHTLLAEHRGLVPTFFKLWFPAVRAAGAMNLGVSAGPKWDAIVKEWKERGGKISFGGFKGLEDIQRELERELHVPQGVKQKTIAAARGMTRQTLGRLVKAIDGLNDTFESATRLASYAAAREKGYSPDRAAALSLEATVNFNRRGRWSPVTNMLYVFSNASTQGSVKNIELLMRSNKYRYLYASLVPLGAMMSALNHLMWPDPDAPEKKSLYTKIPTWEREQNLIIAYGTEKVNGSTKLKYVKIPLAFGFKIPWYLGDQAMSVALGQEKAGKAALNVLSNTIKAFNPVGEGSLVAMAFPTLIKPLVELKLNTDWRERPIVPPSQRWNEGVPNSSQFFGNTNPAAVTIAGAVNRATGGDSFTKGFIDAYPAQLEYAFGFVTGGVGRSIANAWHTGANTVNGIPVPPEKTPFLRQFMGVTGYQAEAQRYYEAHEETTGKQNRLRSARKELKENPDNAEAQATVEKLTDELGAKITKGRETIDWSKSVAKPFQDADKEIKELRTEQRNLRNDKTKTPLERHRRAEKIEGELEILMRDARRDNFDMTRPPPAQRPAP
ncbi:MAG: LPD38 domain-containing protein [Gemmatimonadaceae bacterium]